jgi:hypothetical protein
MKEKLLKADLRINWCRKAGTAEKGEKPERKKTNLRDGFTARTFSV